MSVGHVSIPVYMHAASTQLVVVCRKSKASVGSSPNSSGLSHPVLPGQGAHWDVSQTKPSAGNFTIGSSNMVQRSGMSTNSVGTHLGSATGLVSATYSPLSHQGSLLRKDVDAQKNLRQADLNSVKRTPLSLKVPSVLQHPLMSKAKAGSRNLAFAHC